MGGSDTAGFQSQALKGPGAQVSPPRPQDPTFTVYLLPPANLCPTFFSLKLFPVYLITQAKDPLGRGISDKT